MLMMMIMMINLNIRAYSVFQKVACKLKENYSGSYYRPTYNIFLIGTHSLQNNPQLVQHHELEGTMGDWPGEEPVT